MMAESDLDGDGKLYYLYNFFYNKTFKFINIRQH